MRKIYAASSVVMLGIISTNAFAQLSNKDVLDTVIERYQGAATKWAEIMTGYASYLFWGLALLSMVVTFGYMALRQADPMEVFAELFKFSFTTGFFWWLLSNGPEFSTSIITSLKKAGGAAAQVPGLGPSGIVDIGFDIFFTVLDKTSIMSPIDSLIGATLGLAILLSLTLIAVNMLLLLISGWLLAYGGIFFLGFGGSRWTSDMAIAYYKTALGLGAAVMGMTLITGVGSTLIQEFYQKMSTGLNLKEMAVMLVIAVSMVKLTNTVPNMLAGMVGGNAAASAGNVGAGSVLGAAALAGGAVATGGALAMAGATNIAGGASALKAAFSAAQENMANGTGMFAGAGSGGGSVSSLAQAMGSGQGSGSSGSGSVSAASTGSASSGSGSAADSGAGSSAVSASDSAASGSGNSAGGSGESNSAAGGSGSGSGSAGESSSAGGTGGGEAGAGAASDPADSASQANADPGPWPFPTSASMKAAKDAEAGAQPESSKKPGLLRTGGMFAADMGANLARGIGKIATDKAKENLASLQDSISNTAGGKIAAAIRANTLAAKTGDATEDSLSQGEDSSSQGDSKPVASLSAEDQDEIKAFVNKAA
jgi:type IV secretion system protein TrbL